MRRLRLPWRRKGSSAPLELTLDMLVPPSARRRRAATHEPGSDLEALSREIEQVAAYVSHLKREIGSLKPSDISHDKLPAVREDLTFAAEATRNAVDLVMEAAETIMSTDRHGPDFIATLDAKLTVILEACSFQDIVGQRLARAEGAIRMVERRLERFIETVKVPDATDVFDREAIMRNARREVLLVDGPQGHDDAVEQGAIDKLFA